MSKYENYSLTRFLDVLMSPEGCEVASDYDMILFLYKQAGNDRKKLVKIEGMIKERINEYYKKSTISPLRTLDHVDELSPTYLTEYRAFDRLSNYIHGDEESGLYIDGLMSDLKRAKPDEPDEPNSMYYRRISELENQPQMSELQYIETFLELVVSRLPAEKDNQEKGPFLFFTMKMKEGQVRYLYNALKEKRYIAVDTKEEVFFSAFQPLVYDSMKIVPEKVKWIALKKSGLVIKY